MAHFFDIFLRNKTNLINNGGDNIIIHVIMKLKTRFTALKFSIFRFLLFWLVSKICEGIEVPANRQVYDIAQLVDI